MTRLLVAIAIVLALLLASCAPEPDARRIDGWQTTVDQGW